MLGTDSQAAQLGDSMGSASRRGDAFVWCHIFNKLPRLHLPSLELPQNLPQNIRSVITKSRPWFAHLGATYWRCSENPSLDGMMTFVYHKIVGQKNIFETEFGRLGQVHLVHNTSYVAENSSSLIHEHFGQLDGIPNFTLNSWLHVEGTGRKWVPKAVFPTVEKDPLLFLSLLGPQSCPAFAIDGLQVPFTFFLQEQENSVKARKFSINYQNSVQRSNDGMQFEALLCACICVASHCQGVRGARVDLFLQDLVYNLQRIPQPTDLFSPDLSRFPLLALEGFVIPFLSPPNQQWPSFVESCGNFGNLKRARNADKVDILTSCGLSAEVKDWSSPLPSEDLTNIIVRTPIDSKLHIVLVRKLQEAYYTTGKSFSEAVGTELSNRFAVCKVNLADLVPAIHTMNGIPISNSPSGVILFIVCPE
ncbi:hypothetical protein BDR26DRAFT_864882 [Obelidium mucronatum]|nr:hypothetical protein BDR26DRAFT_864882 [Obelidium mucronatum]